MFRFSEQTSLCKGDDLIKITCTNLTAAFILNWYGCRPHSDRLVQAEIALQFMFYLEMTKSRWWLRCIAICVPLHQYWYLETQAIGISTGAFSIPSWYSCSPSVLEDICTKLTEKLLWSDLEDELSILHRNSIGDTVDGIALAMHPLGGTCFLAYVQPRPFLFAPLSWCGLQSLLLDSTRHFKPFTAEPAPEGGLMEKL